ncbi:MAG TPA: hypothetical protein VMK31_03815 [Sphingomicrobium sp.]|nr:hypothetical protein [Sphingomicrobium sp.]
MHDNIARRELAVIDMARADGPRSADPDLLTVRLARILFGIAAPRPLANERLDAIRRFAVAAWFSTLVPKARLEALFEAGVSHDQAWKMLAYVASRRGVMPQVESWPA